MKNVCISFLFSLLALSAFAQYDESYRPLYHFAPKDGWIGDPCGLIHYQGQYHLLWWGKAVTKDFTKYQEQSPKALVGDNGGFAYYTGSVVVDKNNTALFGKDKMIAVYTMTDRKTRNQSQGISVSDDGILFNYYAGNPVLNINSTEFRDPTVFWHEPTSKWVMVVSSPIERKIKFYSSPDLKQWTWMSDFGPLGSRQNIWECPDIYELALDGHSTNKRWVLMTSVGPNRGQYFVGNFDGTTFALDEQQKEYLLNGKGLPGTVYTGFDGTNYGSWVAEGDSFWESPDANHTSAHLGSGMASSFGGGDGNKGSLTSPEFTIQSNAINFLVAGGSHPNETCINLIINDSVVCSTTGDNSSYMKWCGWDVSGLKGKKAKIQLKDSYDKNDWGYINVDHILFSDELIANQLEHALWVEAGADFYAARAFKDYDGTLKHTTWLAWMNNWDYARGEVPASRGKGFWSVPRNISLKTYPDGICLIQEPVEALKNLRKKEVTYSGTVTKGVSSISGFAPKHNAYEIEAEFTLAGDDEIGFNLCVGDGRSLPVRYHTKTSSMVVDRTNCTSDSIQRFNRTMQGYAPIEEGKLKLRILVDKSSVEIFANSGRLVFTLLTFPGENQTGVELFSKHGSATQVKLSAWEMKTVWK